jgi:hypothetical protein
MKMTKINQCILLICLLGSALCIGAALNDESYILEILPESEQKTLRAGADTECLSNCTTCEIDRACETDEDCAATQSFPVCTDSTDGEQCYRHTWTPRECVMDEAHYCDESMYGARTCSNETNTCLFQIGTEGDDCNDTWVKQCHY